MQIYTRAISFAQRLLSTVEFTINAGSIAVLSGCGLGTLLGLVLGLTLHHVLFVLIAVFVAIAWAVLLLRSVRTARCAELNREHCQFMLDKMSLARTAVSFLTLQG